MVGHCQVVMMGHGKTNVCDEKNKCYQLELHLVLVFLGSKNSVMVGHLKTKFCVPLMANKYGTLPNVFKFL